MHDCGLTGAVGGKSLQFRLKQSQILNAVSTESNPGLRTTFYLEIANRSVRILFLKSTKNQSAGNNKKITGLERDESFIDATKRGTAERKKFLLDRYCT